MKIAEIINLTEEELKQKLRTLKEELFNLNIQRKMGRVEKPHMIGKLRKDVARIKTVLKEKMRQKEDAR